MIVDGSQVYKRLNAQKEIHSIKNNLTINKSNMNIVLLFCCALVVATAEEAPEYVQLSPEETESNLLFDNFSITSLLFFFFCILQFANEDYDASN